MKSPCKLLGHFWVGVAVSSDGKMLSQMCRRCTVGRLVAVKELEERCQPSEASPAASVS